jgi:hypothetical protein
MYDLSGIEGQTADLSSNDIKLINWAKKHNITTPTEIRETVGASFNKDKPPTDEEIEAVIKGTTTKPTGIFAARGGIARLANGGGVAEAKAEQMLKMEYQKYRNQGGTMSYQRFKMMVLQQAQSQGPMAQGQPQMAQPQMAAEGGRIGLANGGVPSSHVPGYTTPAGYNKFDYPTGGVRVGAQEGGLMNLGGMEKDYRQEGGFVPLGKKEKADDVPARLSKNEFVFTADAVRNAGGGDIDAGAEVMENVMNNLEAGGEISEESQGAQGMYDQQQMLQSRMV